MAMATRRRSPVRAVLRFAASVMMLSGVLLLADAGLTLAWQEPISALMADRQQTELKRKFRDPPPRVLRRKPLEGDAIARIELPTIDKSAYVVQGTDMGTLRKGPGHYPETPLPGEGGTVGIAGHRTTYCAPFRNIDDLKRGDPIRVAMPDGTFYYRVEENKIVDNDDTSVKRKVGYDRLLLSACHPLHSAAQRVIIFAKLVRRGRAKVTK
jgi:sortase A